MKICGLLLFLVMRAVAGGVHSSEFRAEPYFLGHEDVPAASIVPILFGTAHQVSYDDDTVALLKLVGEFFNVEVVFLRPGRSHFYGHVGGFSINIALFCLGVVAGRGCDRHAQDSFVASQVLAGWSFGDVTDESEGNISHGLFLDDAGLEDS